MNEACLDLLKKLVPKVFQVPLLIIVVFSLVTSSVIIDGKAARPSSYNYKFTVDREGFTDVEINFTSTIAQGASWVFVPKAPAIWNYTVTKGTLSQPEVVETDQVVQQSSPFYQAFKFRYEAVGTFNMTIRFGFRNGAMIIEPRGVFYSPWIGFQWPDSDGNALVVLANEFQVDRSLAVVVGAVGTYPATSFKGHQVFFLLPENQVRLQVEFRVGFETPQFTTLRSSDNETFTFKVVTRYTDYAQSILNLYDRIYGNFTRLFNATLDNVTVQFFIPDFETLLSVGGFVPFTGEELGEININVFFVRAVNGTIEVIAAHELVHRFIGKTGISPGNFLWFHEGMAQYISITSVAKLNYEGATQQRDNLEDSASNLIDYLGGENFGTIQLQYWTPSYQPQNVDIQALYAASYYVVSRLPQVVQRDGLDYYGRFFKSVHGTKVDDINILALYLSIAANASVALTLRLRWGFSVADLFNSSFSQLIEEAGKTVQGVNPVFQPYRSLAEYFYNQALLSAGGGDWDRARSFLELSISLANLAPLLTFLTILAILAIVAYILHKRSLRPKPTVPVPPPEILQPTT